MQNETNPDFEAPEENTLSPGALVQMSAGAERPRDEIELDATPPVRMTIEGGIMGDLATAAIIVNAVPRVVAHAPGLIAMLDLPVVAGRGTER